MASQIRTAIKDSGTLSADTARAVASAVLGANPPARVKVQASACSPITSATRITPNLAATGQPIRGEPGEHLEIPAAATDMVASATPTDTPWVSGGKQIWLLVLAFLGSGAVEAGLNAATQHLLTHPDAVTALWSGLPHWITDYAPVGTAYLLLHVAQKHLAARLTEKGVLTKPLPFGD